MAELGLLVVVLFIFLFSISSNWLSKSSTVTLPIAFMVLGWLLNASHLKPHFLEADSEVIQVLAEITLMLVLFSDASRINLKSLLADFSMPLRMLLIGMPLTILFGAMLSYTIVPGATLTASFLLAAILTPTDAALGQTVVTNPVVPARIRQTINVESGLNDGIAVPFVMIFAILAVHNAGGTVEGGPDNLLVFTIMQVLLGPLAGIIIGFLGALVINTAVARGWAESALLGVAFMMVAVIAYLSAEIIGGNGFIAAFIGGLVFGNRVESKSEHLFEFIESEGQLLTLLTFFMFGAILLPMGLEHMTWATIVIAILFLTIVRMLPIFISLLGLGLKLPTILFLGWFGPRGLASILFALMVAERFKVPDSEELLSCVVLTVFLSILLHGWSALPLAKAYGRYVKRTECGMETEDVPEEHMSRPPMGNSKNTNMV